MKRRNHDRSVSENISTSKRIVRRRVRRSASPEVVETSRPTKREVHVFEESFDSDGGGGGKFNKYAGTSKFSKYSNSQSAVTKSHGSAERIGGMEKSRYSNYSPLQHRGAQQGTEKHRPTLQEKFEYSLRVGNIDLKLTDLELKQGLFREFKRFGYINIKVLGYAKDRHAFVNFTCENDARRALQEMKTFVFERVTLQLDWSRSTLIRFPAILGKNKRRSVTSNEDYHQQHTPRNSERTTGGGGGSEYNSARSSARSIQYRTSNLGGANPSSSSHSVHTQSSESAKAVVPVIDPSATRTLFVGNLEQDITERELRDLFSPYGRIECVDIKLQRASATSYAFVKFLTINDAINAKNDMHGRQYGELTLKIGFGRGSPSTKVWIGNLTSYNDMSEIRSELDRFGLIRRIDYNDGDNHGFVHFDSLDAAQTAVTTMAGFRLRTGHPIKIDMSKPLHLRLEAEEMEAELNRDSRQNTSNRGSFSSSDIRRSHSNGESHSHVQNPHSRENESMRGEQYRGGGGGSRDDNQYTPNGRRSPFTKPQRFLSENPVSSNSGKRERERREIFERNHIRKRPHPSDSSNARPQQNTRQQQQRERDDLSDLSQQPPKRPRNGYDARERIQSRVAERQRASGGGRSGDSANPRRNDAREREREERNAPHPDTKTGDAQDKQSSSDEQMKQPKTEAATTTTEMDTPVDVNDSALKLHDTTEPTSPGVGSKLPIADSVENIQDLAKLFPVVWHGSLVLKNTGFPTRMHLIGGDPAVAESLLRCKEDFSALRITQRLRLEPPRLDEVNKRMASSGPSGHCILLALPGPTPSQSMSPEHSTDSSTQLRPLKSLVSYLKQKEAAGIVALNCSEDSDGDVIGVLHAFPPCEFSQSQLLKIAPNIGAEPAKEDHIVVLLVKGTV